MSEEIDFNAPEPGELSQLLPGYEVKELIAKGGMGAVYRATQVSLDREVAIKVLPEEFGDESFRAQFATEAKAMARLNHQNLIGIFDFGEVEGMPYIVMEYVAGQSLYHTTYQNKPEQEEALRLIMAICGGLGHAHDAGILHRDIKPANILMNERDEPKIGDFGLARPSSETGGEDIIYGTPGYAAPEVVNRPEEVDRQSDIFAVGVMLHELLTGQLPDDTGTPPSRISGSDPRLDPIVRKATHLDPARRYATAEEMAADLAPLKGKLRKSLVAPQGAAAPARPIPASRGGRAKAPKVGSNAPFVRNLFIIALLSGALYFVYQAYEAKKERIAAEEAEIERQAAADKAAKLKEAEEAAAAAQAEREAAMNQQPTNNESPMESLARLKSRLQAGDFSELPVGTLKGEDDHFFFVDKELSWDQAAAFCEEYGGHLATIRTDTGSTYLNPLLGQGHEAAWLGGAAVGSTWKWLDGSEWILRKPSTSLGRFISLTSAGIIKPAKRNEKLPFIIEWDITNGPDKGDLAQQLLRVRSTLKSEVPNWPPATFAFENRRYLLVQRAMSWTEARKIADSAAGKLAVPSNNDENYYLRDYLDQNLAAGGSCWLGGSLVDGEWAWITGEQWTFADWKPGAPKAGGGAAVLRYVTGDPAGWADAAPDDQTTSAFLIEWSDDALRALPEPEAGSEFADLKSRAKELVGQTNRTYLAAVKKAADDLVWEMDTWLRGLPKTQQEAYGPGVQQIKTDLGKNPHISENIPREGMPEKLVKTLDHYLGKQHEAKATLISELN
ncbi:MAG: protein kinase domain-containing protein, partial [Verrucomicrobiales bacterium]